MTNVKVAVKDIKSMNNQPNKIYLNIGADGECQDFEELVGVSWCEDKINDDDLEYISVNFIKSFIDKYVFEHKTIWNDNEYLKENYPDQFLIKKLLKK